MTEYTQQTPNDGDEAIFFALPQEVRTVISNYNFIDPKIAKLMRTMAENSYLKGRIDATEDHILTLKEKTIEEVI